MVSQEYVSWVHIPNTISSNISSLVGPEVGNIIPILQVEYLQVDNIIPILQVEKQVES